MLQLNVFSKAFTAGIWCLLWVFQALWLCSEGCSSNFSPVSVAGIFKGQESELCLCSGAVCLDSWVFIAVGSAFVLFRRLGDYDDQSVFCCGCIVVIRGRDDLSLWLMGVVSWSFVCSDHWSLWLGRVCWPFVGCIFQRWEPDFVEF